MAVKKIQNDWQIQPTTATENAEIQASMAAALAEQQNAEEQVESPAATTEMPTEETTTTEEATTNPTLYDYAARVWGVPVQRKAQEVANARVEKEALDEVAAETKRRLEEAKKNHSSFLSALLEEQKPKYDEDAEKKLRRRAIIKGFGDLVGAVASGAHAFGKRGMGVVPTLSTTSPLKDIEKISEMQSEYKKRMLDWRALDVEMRKAAEDAKLAGMTKEAAEAEKAAQLAKSKHDEAVKGYEEAQDALNEKMFAIAQDEQKEARADARAARIKTATSGKDQTKDQTKDIKRAASILEAAQALYDDFVSKYLTSENQTFDKKGVLSGSSKSIRNIWQLSDNEKENIAALYESDPKVVLYMLFPDQYTAEQIKAMTKDEAMTTLEKITK